MSDATTLSLIPRSPAEAEAVSRQLAPAELLPPALRKRPADVLAIVLTGAELGLGPMASIRSIHLIEGKPTLSADLIGALVMRRPDVCEYLRLVESTAKRATYETKRKGHPEPVRLTWSIEQAQAAGLAGRGNWAKYPDAMLRARCTTAICRAVYPDLVGGLYDPEEMDVTPAERQPAVLSVVRGPVVEGEVMGAPPAVETPPAPRPTPPPDYDASGAPLSERAKLEVAIQEAADRPALDALLPRIKALAKADQDSIRKLYMVRLKDVTPKAVAK